MGPQRRLNCSNTTGWDGAAAPRDHTALFRDQFSRAKFTLDACGCEKRNTPSGFQLAFEPAGDHDVLRLDPACDLGGFSDLNPALCEHVPGEASFDSRCLGAGEEPLKRRPSSDHEGRSIPGRIFGDTGLTQGAASISIVTIRSKSSFSK